MVRIGLVAEQILAKRIFRPDRREVLLAGLGASAAVSGLPALAATDAPQRLTLRAAVSPIKLRSNQPDFKTWSLQALPPAGPLRPRALEVAFQNDLPVPATLDWRGIDGAAAAEPLAAQPPIAAGSKADFAIALRRPGTLLCELRPLGDTSPQPCRPLALVVEESAPPTADRDEVLLIEDWRLRADGTAVVAGSDPGPAEAVFTVNGQLAADINVRSGQRLRLRLISGCQRAAIAVKIEGAEVRVMALDGAPAEPFMARNGAIVLAPGGRADVLVDVAATAGASSPILLHDGKEARQIGRLATSAEPPLRQSPLPPASALPAGSLPAQLDMKAALRVELPLAGPDWTPAHSFTASSTPAFQAKAGRTAVLALANRAATTTVFHLHGHHFRLLDRLDDGWKPFWLDTLAIEPGQTQRVAFSAEYTGRWLLESVGTDWTAPRLVRWYGVN
jgi:FtsP/CotA-like multicopper oxidase with cupredoxin domain